MKLRKQAPAKAFILVAALGLLLGFFGIVKSEPRIKAAETESIKKTIDYRRFFAPPTSGQTPQTEITTHTRTRAS